MYLYYKKITQEGTTIENFSYLCSQKQETEEEYSGYERKEFGIPVKRYCQTKDLKDDPKLINSYIEAHNRYNSWPEIRTGIRALGLLL